jgi:hypothetical protein
MRCTFCWCFLCLSLTAFGQNPSDGGSFLLDYDDIPKSEVMVLGTYHFRQDQHYDELSPENQREIDRVLSALAAYQPTKVVIEWEPQNSAKVNLEYQQYLNGNFSIDTLVNEGFQLGFKLAKKIGHQSVYLFDDQTEFIGSLENFSFDSLTAYAEQNDTGFYDIHMERLISTFNKNQAALDELGIYDRLVQMNSPQATRINAQRMHLYEVRIGIQKSWIGPDWLGRWYRRNVRMMSNVLKFSEPPNDRILIIVGDNHKWVLEQMFDYCPDFKVVSAYEYLSDYREKTSVKRSRP